MDMTTEALILFDLGLTPIPLSGKRPVQKGWQKRPVTKDDIVNGFKEEGGEVVTFQNKNIGIVTGKASDCVVVDIDSEEALQRLKKMGELPRTWTVKTGRGWHLYYNYIPLPSCKPTEEVDFLSDKKQVVAPPSIHPSGHQYRWAISPNEIERADLPKWFIELIGNKKTKPLMTENKKSLAKKTSNSLYKKTGKKKSIEELLITVNWIDFYSRFVSNITGSGEWLSSTCPFHDDQNNSFGFHSQTGGWCCFAGCGSGNGLQAIQKLYGVSIKQAIRIANGENIYV